MWARTKAVVLVLLMALTVLPIGILGGNNPRPTGTSSGELRLLTLQSPELLRILPALGMQVVVDYNNGYYLVRGGEFEASYLKNFGITDRTSSDLTTLEFTASGYSFDPQAGLPALPDYLTAVSDEKIIQFIGPAKPEWMNAVESTGARFGYYSGGSAYIAKIGDEQIAAIRALPFVKWIGQYEPAYKIDSRLFEKTGVVPIDVIAYDGVSEEQLQLVLWSLGAEIVMTSPQPTTVQALVYPWMIPAIARSADVYQIYWSPEEKLLDYQEGEIHGFHEAWTPSKSGLPTNLTGHSPGPDGIYGTSDDIFEVVGIIDSGFDANTPNAGWDDVFDGPLTDRVIRLQRRTAQCGLPDGQVNGVAHGTHVAGIVISNGFDWEYAKGLPTNDMEWSQSEAGIAPEGKMSFDCAGSGSGIASSPTYWDDEYADGAKTMSNSYGSNPGPYGQTAIQVDTRIDASNDKMIIFAAGNDGPDPGSVSQEAKAKNGLTIGASQNFRPDQFEADNPNLIADFSSRGTVGDRIKPDLVAIGTAVVSGLGFGEWIYNSRPTGQGVPQPDYILGVDVYNHTNPTRFDGDGMSDYRYMQGTSMAAPTAAGLYMLTREYFREVYGIENVNSQLAKAMLINGAVRMDPNLYDYPGIDQGWGRIDLEQSLFPPAPRTNQWQEGLFNGPDTWTPSTINMNVMTPDVPLKVTLVWVDTPGSLLNRNLDLIVRSPDGSVEYHGNQYATSGVLKGWTDPSETGFDSINNVEQVEIKYPTPGLWSVTVIGVRVTTTAKFALIFSADVGSSKTYQVNIDTKYPTILGVAPEGTVALPFVVRNFGTSADNIAVSSLPLPPPGLVATYSWSVSPFQPNQWRDNMVTITAEKAITAGLYSFCVFAVSGDDPSVPPSSDSLCLQVEVLKERLPYPRRITSEGIDELDPSVLTFNDTGGVKHVFIAYRKTTAVNSLDPTHGGTNVWVAHTTVDANHEPQTPWNYSVASDWNDYPNDLRMLQIDYGPFKDRVVITWTGQDPLESDPNTRPYGRMAFSDPPYSTWQQRTIEKNYGSMVYNSARVSFPVFRRAGGPNGTLIWVWEHLDSVSRDAPAIGAVQTHAAYSWDGGNTWGQCLPENDPDNRCYKIAPRGDNNFYFFPNGAVDQNDVLWVFFYWRLSGAGQGRRLAVALWDGAQWNKSWTTPINIWDAGGNVNIQFPAAVSTPEGGNRIYVAVTNDQGKVDKQLYALYAEGTFGSGVVGPPPQAAPTPGISPSFTAPKGPFGSAVSDANYNRRPVLNIVYTDDGIVWIPYMEANTVYNQPNMWTWSSSDGFVTPDQTIVTADAFAKGHQMSDTLTIGSKSCVYEVWHENIAPTGEVNYDVYLAIYCAGWENEPDNLGPLTVNQATMPNPYNKTYPTNYLKIMAEISDVTTGFNNISAAELVPTALSVSDPSMVDWSNAWTMNLTGVNKSPTETASLWANWTVAGWPAGTCHRFWIRGQDDKGNWGPGDFVDICVTEAVAMPPPPPVMQKAELEGTNWVNVKLTWGRSFDDGNGVNNVLLYKIWRATDIHGPYSLITTVPALKQPVYTWTDVGAGHLNFTNYFYFIQANSSFFDSPPTRLAAKFFRTMADGGKQLLSFPLIQANGAPSVVFQTFTFDSVRTYSPVDQDHWKSYKPGRPYNDISTLDIDKGYWVDMTAPGTMTVAGLVPENVVKSLYFGWNLIGFPSFNGFYTVASFAASLGGNVRAVEIYDKDAGPYYLQRLDPSDWATTLMQPGIAYWVWVSSTVDWAVPGY